jgi:hypothetical protein
LPVEVEVRPRAARACLPVLLPPHPAHLVDWSAGFERLHQLEEGLLAFAFDHDVDRRVQDRLLRQQGGVDATPHHGHARRLAHAGGLDAVADLRSGHGRDAEADGTACQLAPQGLAPAGVSALVDDLHVVAGASQR